MSKKYIYANIRLPIEMSENGSFYEVFSDRMTIDFELCKILPDPTSYENKELIAKIFAIQHEEVEEQQVIVEEQQVDAEEQVYEEQQVTDEEQQVDEEEEQVTDEEEEQAADEEMKILKREFKHKINKSRHNMSFRRRFKPNSLSKFTKRTYS